MNLEGQMLGQYQITQMIGGRSMATVYLGYQPNLEREVALKILLHQTTAPILRERFVREARAVARLNHPNIMPIYDVGQTSELSYVVMKHVSGQPLSRRLGRPLPLEAIGHYIDQIAGALDHAHNQGVLHRNLKPSNILLDDDWLLLTDFGLGQVLDDHKLLAQPEPIMGAPHYISPEQAQGRPIDRRSDVYALGMILYEMATGRLPFEADTPLDVVLKQVYEPLPPPRQYHPTLLKPIEHIIIKALDKNPDNRYQRAGELNIALQRQIASADRGEYRAMVSGSNRFFISYQANVRPDQQLAAHLYNTLSREGHQVFIDRGLRSGDERLAEIERQIRQSDFIVALLSKESSYHEMIRAEIDWAYEHRQQHGRPVILPVRVGYEGDLPYAIDPLLDSRRYLAWHDEGDNQRLAAEILAAAEGRLPIRFSASRLARPTPNAAPVGLAYPPDDNDIYPPLPEFDPRLVETLTAPGGSIRLQDRFYIERPADDRLKREIIRPGTTISIRASRQMGKSSLLARGLHHALEHGFKVVNLDLQRLDQHHLASPNLFLRDLAEFIVRKLDLDPDQVERAWAAALGPQDKLTCLLEEYILPAAAGPIVLALDEVDRLLLTGFHSSFFALLRTWHNSRALDSLWQRLNLILVISTEPDSLISDDHQSPFNVGLNLTLDDFDEAQVEDLNQRHGSPLSPEDLLQLMALLGGHPYLTRRALYSLVVEQMTWADLLRVATADQGPFGDHLRRQRWLLRDEPQLRAAMKLVIETSDCEQPLELFRLLRSGLIKRSGQTYVCRCNLYRRYFKDKLS